SLHFCIRCRSRSKNRNRPYGSHAPGVSEMRCSVSGILSCALFTLLVLGQANAQDPRVGLKPGFHDAGVAARNMELVKSLPKPYCSDDPQPPAGTPTPPEADPNAPAAQPGNAPAAAAQPAPASTPPPSGLNFANSDLAFSKDHLFIGNFNGFNTYS